MYALNFYSPTVTDQLRHRRKTATIRLGNKAAKYKKGMVVQVLVGMRFREKNPDQTPVESTLRHEIGHCLGLAATTHPDAAKTTNKLYRYQNGPHCMADENKCVMYHEIGMHVDFCETCCTALKARDLSKKLPINASAHF